MERDPYATLNEIKSAIKDYELATNVNCYLFDSIGKKIGDRSCYECASICNFIKKFDPNGICTHDYLCNCKQTLNSDSAHFYFCPYGLLNITIPIFLENETTYFASTGPILIQPPNKFLLSQFTEQNESLSPYAGNISELLQQLPLKDGTHLHALSNTLLKSIHNLPFPQGDALHFREKQQQIISLISDLKQHIRSSLYPNMDNHYYTLEKEIELISQTSNIAMNQKALEMILYRFVDKIYKHNIFEESKYRAARFFYTLFTIAQKKDINLESIFGEKCCAIRHLLDANSYDHLNHIFLKTIDRFKQAFFALSHYKNNKIILQVMEYIREEYMDISLQKVANAVSLNATYLSDIFKKETGQSYSDYLNKVRIEASKQLLREHMPVAQIAQNIGFADQSYFIKVFKRYEGVSPSKWRE